MKIGQRAILKHAGICIAAVFLVTASLLEAVTPDFQPVKGSPARDIYELRFLGSEVKLDPRSHEHIGLFLFIWKGQKPIKILGYLSQDGKEILPFPEFGLHHKSGWESVGEWCGTGAQWIEIQPGQVMTFHMLMGWIEHDTPAWKVKDADQACMVLSCTGGAMVSDVFPLPL